LGFAAVISQFNLALSCLTRPKADVHPDGRPPPACRQITSGFSKSTARKQPCSLMCRSTGSVRR
jgi:hypothetical protein